MTARQCFTGKIAAGRVAERAGRELLKLLDDFEANARQKLGDDPAALRQAAIDTAEVATGMAARAADDARDAIIKQGNVLRAFAAYEERVKALRDTKGDFGFGNKAPATLGKETQSTLGHAVRSLLARDPFEVATWNNVDKLAQALRGDAHRVFADAIEYLRPKALGLKAEAMRELDFLRAAYGRSDVDDGARAAADAWFKAGDPLADRYIAEGGALFKRERYFPNVAFDENKVRAIGAERFMQLARENVDRARMIDFQTGKPLSDASVRALLKEAAQSIRTGGIDGDLPSAAFKSARMLANSRDHARFFVWKDAETWMQMAEAVGTHASPFQAVVDHIDSITKDTAL
jgi:hypothetical protein